MQPIGRSQLCEIAAEVIAKELGVPEFLKHNTESIEYKNARYLYVYFCHVHLNASFPLIRTTLPVYNYPKTVYQVFRRQYKRNQTHENKFLVQVVKQEMEKKLQHYASR